MPGIGDTRVPLSRVFSHREWVVPEILHPWQETVAPAYAGASVASPPRSQFATEIVTCIIQFIQYRFMRQLMDLSAVFKLVPYGGFHIFIGLLGIKIVIDQMGWKVVRQMSVYGMQLVRPLCVKPDHVILAIYVPRRYAEAIDNKVKIVHIVRLDVIISHSADRYNVVRLPHEFQPRAKSAGTICDVYVAIARSFDCAVLEQLDVITL